jgi:Protein of unknown function (DUF1207)
MHMMRKAVLLLGLAAVSVSPPPAAAQFWGFEGRRYFDPLRAGVREANVSAALGMADRVDFTVEPDDPRLTWDIDVGAEMPLFGWESRAADDGRVPDGAFGIGLWFPIDFHLLEDFADDSAPILNTDYRFGLMAKMQAGIGDERWLGVRAFVGHESTHLGDEFSIVGQRTYPDQFERINVSWEYLDLAAQLDQFIENWLLAARLGVTSTLPFEDSYYSTEADDITESPLGPVVAARLWWDPYLGFEVEQEEAIGRWSVYLSNELRWRSIYEYHRADPEVSEDRKLSYNGILGLRVSGGDPELGRVSPFLRFYHGVNPHGQFRNQDDFTFYAFGLRLVR